MPVLDGLDELPQATRALALQAVNQVLPAGQPLVLSSRTAEYRNALTPEAGATVLLNGAAGIRLLPLDAGKSAVYLERDAGGSGTQAAARWSRVIASLGTGTPVSQALSTPLGLFLARTIYNPRPDEHPADLAHPDELLDQARFLTREAIVAHLFAAFIPAAYRPHPHHPTRWSAQQAQRTLTFLARHLQHTLDGTPNLAWWQLSKALPKYGLSLTLGLVVGLAFMLAYVCTSGLIGLVMAGFLMSGLVTVRLVRFVLSAAGRSTTSSAKAKDKIPSSGIRWNWKKKSWLAGGLVGGLLGGVAFVFRFWFEHPGPRVGLEDRVIWTLLGVIFGVMIGLAGGLMYMIRPVHADLDKAVGPGAVLARDRRTFLFLALIGGLGSMLTLGLGRGPAGLTVGLPYGLISGLGGSVWGEFLVTRIGLAVLGRVPWRLMSFLADAHERRGVLRQVGAVYQFRHLDLQRHLAGRQS
ncbi:MAG: hypothetical protein JO362_10430 [Streptomycetaceae bacterium]|nr:hypothetical protein [Streptomycetaceae bacterium]